jgi:predicted nucleic acid-binding protein
VIGADRATIAARSPQEIDKAAGAGREQAVAAFVARVRPRERTWRLTMLPGPEPLGEAAMRVRVEEEVERVEVALRESDLALASWRRPAALASARPAELAVDDAIAIATAEACPPPGEAEVDFVQTLDGVGLVLVAWKHLHHGVWVEPDFIMATIDPSTRRVCAISRRWSVVPPEAGVPEMP